MNMVHIFRIQSFLWNDLSVHIFCWISFRGSFWALDLRDVERQSLNPNSASYQLCELRQVTKPPWSRFPHLRSGLKNVPLAELRGLTRLAPRKKYWAHRWQLFHAFWVTWCCFALFVVGFYHSLNPPWLPITLKISPLLDAQQLACLSPLCSFSKPSFTGAALQSQSSSMLSCY